MKRKIKNRLTLLVVSIITAFTTSCADYTKYKTEVHFENGKVDTLYLSDQTYIENNILYTYTNQSGSRRAIATGVKYVKIINNKSQ